MPILLKNVAVFFGPFENEPLRPPGKITSNHIQRIDGDHCFVLGIRGVEMRRTVLSPEHLDHDAKKS